MSTQDSTLLTVSTVNQVTRLTMNLPEKLNGWNHKMMDALKCGLRQAASDPGTRVVILTGTDPYYSAGVNLAGSIRFGHPKALHSLIVKLNQALFDAFLDFPKPILAAINGPAIGASATSALLCDGIIVSDKARFSTPFARLGVASEGCSSYLFPKILGEHTANRILGEEGWAPSGKEAYSIQLAEWITEHDQLLDEAQRIAEQWAASYKTRTFRGGATRDKLKQVNAEESIRVADSFLSSQFLGAQFEFLWKRKKRIPALMFLLLKSTRPWWIQLS